MRLKNLKKLVAIILCTVIATSAFGITANASIIDSDITIQDVTLVQKVAVGQVDLTKEYLSKYDYNSDNLLNILDATLMQKALVEDYEYSSSSTNTESSTYFTSSSTVTTVVTEPNTEETESETKATVRTTTEPTESTVKYTTVPTTTVVTTTTIEPTEATTLAPTSISVNKSSLTLGVGEQYKLITTCDVSNASITYSSDNTTVATVSSDGTIAAQSNGSAVISCKTSNGLIAKCTVTVKKMSNSVSLNKTSLELGINEEYKLIVSVDNESAAYFRYFSSSNNNVATVSSSGNIKALSVGTAAITCKLSNGKTATCNVTVGEMADSVTLNKSSLTLGVGETFDINSYIPDGTSAYFRLYSSSATSTVSVDTNSGIVQAQKTGSAIITCKLYNGVNTTCTITVKAAPSSVSLSVSSKTLKVGNDFTISENTNTGSYAYNFTWSSSNKKVATVTKTTSNKAKISPRMQGTATITIKTYNGKTATCKITVSGSSVKCVDVSTWQGSNIDFNKVKSDGIDYVILRAGYGKETYQKDDTFETNYSKAKAAGLKVGVYWFSYAMSASEAISEAKACLYCLGNKQLDMPVYYDMEYAPAITSLSKSTYTQMAVNFCDTIEDSGYDAGVYASASVYSYPLNYDTISSKYSIWNAEWNSYYTVNCDLWQYTDCAQVNGISGNVDMSYIYNLNIVK